VDPIPPSYRELLKVGLGFYCMVAGFAMLALWDLRHQLDWAVIIVLACGLVGVLLLEGIATGVMLILASFRYAKGEANKRKTGWR